MWRNAGLFSHCPRTVSRPLLAALLLGVSGCAHRRPPELSAPLTLSVEIQEILAHEHTSPEYFDAQRRLAKLGPEVDAVLVDLSRNPEVNPVARANALVLLGERRSPAAIDVLRDVLLTSNRATLRSAAVLGLQRLAAASDTAASLIRSAVGDPARTVRLNALQALDVRQVATLRSLLAVERDPEVRQVAAQLVVVAESRGAPLAADSSGVLRTLAPDINPVLAFHPTRVDSVGGFAVGDLRIEVPQVRDIPLGSGVEVVGNVVPAFFSPDRSRVVYEVDRRVEVLDLVSRMVYQLGDGIAPRLIPFSNEFVFVREMPGARREIGDQTELLYEVYRVSFAQLMPERIGELRATARMDRHRNYSPVRWMVVAETPEGSALRGEGITTFLLPSPIWDGSPLESSGGPFP